jgi:formylglycine-generating enzyme
MVRCLIFSFLIIVSLQAISQAGIDLKQIENKLNKTNKSLSKEFAAIKIIPAKSSVDSFYISPSEVTLKQYREFLEYIQDSILRKLMGYVKHDDDDNEYIDYSKKITRKDMQRMEKYDGIPQPIFININAVMLFKPKYFVYSYQVENKRIQIPVMPDTSIWNLAYSFYKNKPVVTDDFWLPAFNNYPVTGISNYQAQAYCHWKTQQLKIFLGNNYDLDINISLPTASQCESALASGQLITKTKKTIDEATGFRYIVSFKRKTE